MIKSNSYSKILSTRRSLLSFDSAKIKTIASHPTSSRNKLDGLRSRNEPEDEKVPGDVAAKVVKNYLLPMFEQNAKQKAHSERQKSHGILHRRSLSIVKGSVYEDLKLIETLSEQIRSLKHKLFENDQVTHSYLQDKHSLIKDLEHSQSETDHHKTQIEFLIQENQTLHKEIDKIKLQTSLSSDLSDKLQLLDQISGENIKIKHELQEYKADNDIRYNFTIFS
ncbi:hypothetical protein SteCoe_1023 [Stentor coeruleus]|uniref:Uncharacterized protein n=1 Tax=Stentor coeruleus TaxID=5963 RepID=A0A1R2D2V2_9CILI|nr:hypothetical protein SteCoe_1023 [Stentor coeruleus]